MLLGHDLDGRHEKRLPIVVVVQLEDPEQQQQSNSREKTYSGNISPHGACVASKRPWPPGKEVEIVSITNAVKARGKVVYCRQGKNGRFFVGLNFRERPVCWSNFSYAGFP
jgi:PilZ domain-containing protein